MPPQSSQSPSTPTGPPGRKSVLFCPECGHESPVDGDWQVQTSGGDHVYRCPACREVITTRPANPQSPVSSPSRDPHPGSVSLRFVRLVLVWAAWPYTPAEWARGFAARRPLSDDESATMSTLAA